MRKSIGLFVAPVLVAAGLSAAAIDAAAAAPRTYGAVIKSNGARAPGKYSAGVTSKQLATGSYLVNFRVQVTRCIFNATVGSASAANQDGGFAKVAYVAGKPKSVKVVTLSSGAAADRSFHLIVFCP
jgi:hypothetical protein